MSEVVKYIADAANVSIIVDQGLEDRAIYIEVDDQPVDDVLAAVARRVGASVRQLGDIRVVGQLDPADRGVLVRRVRRLDRESLQRALAVFSGDNGRSVAFDDGLVVVGDRLEVLQSVATMLDRIESSEVAVWVVEMNLLGWSRQAADDFGIDLEPAANVALGFAVGSTVGATASWELGASLDALLQVAIQRDDVRIAAAPMFVLVDGTDSEFVLGDRVPVPRRSTSDAGTTTTEGFDYVQTGVQVRVGLREMSPASALLNVSVEMSDVRSFVEEAPITSEEQFQTNAVVEAGGVYLLGSMHEDREDTQAGLGWFMGDSYRREVQVTQVWARIYRIGGSLTEDDEQGVVQGSADLLRSVYAAPAAEQEPDDLSPSGERASELPPAPLFDLSTGKASGPTQQ